MPIVDGTIPWTGIRAPTPTAAVVPVSVPGCTGETLDVSLGGMEGATAGQMVGSIEFKNAGTEACYLVGNPTVLLLDAAGRSMPVRTFVVEPRFGPEQPKPTTWPKMLLAVGEHAEAFVQSSSWCGPHVSSWEIVLPDGSHVVLTHGWTMGLCQDAGGGSLLSVGGFEPPQSRPRWPFVPMLDDQMDVGSGSNLRYVVTLMNASSHPFRFPSQCPAFQQAIVRSHEVIISERFVLNCSDVGLVPGDTAIRFDMKMHIPATLHGEYSLMWRLDPPYGFDRKAQLVVG